jgi:hypothetical protein
MAMANVTQFFFFNWTKKLYLKPESAQNLNCKVWLGSLKHILCVFLSLDTKLFNFRDRQGRDRMVLVVVFTTICAISVYHLYSCEFESRSWQSVLDTTLCDKVCHWLAAGLWFSPGTPVSSTNKTDCHDITEILLEVALNTINQPTI